MRRRSSYRRRRPALKTKKGVSQIYVTRGSVLSSRVNGIRSAPNRSGVKNVPSRRLAAAAAVFFFALSLGLLKRGDARFRREKRPAGTGRVLVVVDDKSQRRFFLIPSKREYKTVCFFLFLSLSLFPITVAGFADDDPARMSCTDYVLLSSCCLVRRHRAASLARRR